MSSIIVDARELAKEAHDGQTRWDGSSYFENHIEKVVEILQSKRGSLPGNWNSDAVFDCLVTAAYLHDVVEDTHMTLDDLKVQFPPLVVELVEIVTKQDNEDYFAFIMRINGSSNYGAKVLKACDITHNLSTLPAHKRDKRALYEMSRYVLEIL
jgi:(p)ppGpp synthase/HD superfamily hydrolase